MGRWDALRPQKEHTTRRRPLPGAKPNQQAALNLQAQDSIQQQCEFFIRNFHQLSSRVAIRWLAESLLPHMLSVDEQNLESTCFRPIHLALKQHPTELMAPLTQGVTVDGVEEMAENQVRLSLFRVLQRFLLSRHASEDLLIQALEAAQVLEGSVNHAKSNHRDLEFSVVQNYLNSCPAPNWNLLLAYLRRHPGASTSFVSQILFCGTNQQTPRFHRGFKDQLFPFSEILLTVIPQWPLAMWLDESRSHGVSLYQRRVIHGIAELMAITLEWWKRRAPVELSKLWLLRSPCIDALEKPGDRLVEVLSEFCLMDSSANAAFVEVCGGKEQPNGQKTSMSPFLRKWLDSSRGHKFMRKLLRIMSTKNDEATAAQKCLCAVASSHVRSCLSVEAEIRCAIHTMCVNKKRTLATSLLEACFHGFRKNTGDQTQTQIPESFIEWSFPCLKSSLLDEHSGSCRSSAASAIGSLRKNDWQGLIQKDEALDTTELMERLCCDLSTGNKWRSLGLKALGDMVVNLLAAYVPIAIERQIVDRLVKTLMATLNETNAEVRCMSLFLLGNLAQVLLHQGKSELVCDTSVSDELSQISSICLSRLQDGNDKVAGNAIRSCGHLATLRWHCYQVNDAGSGWEATEYTIKVLDELSSKIQSAISLESQKTTHLSWKERSSLKKHSRGACNALANILEQVVASDNELDKSYCYAVDTLLACIQRASSLHGKVVFAASRALRARNARGPRLLSCRGLPAAVSSCVLLLRSQNGPIGSPAKDEMQELLPCLLRDMTPADAAKLIVMMQEIDERESLSFLFECMASHDFPADLYIPFSLAIQRPGIELDIGIERILFANSNETLVVHEDEL